MRRLLLLVILVVLPRLATAQMAASLVADHIDISAGGQLVASGNVEAFYGDTRLSAARIVYDQTTDRLLIDGPIFIQTGDGVIFTATQAEIGARLQNGILLGARLVLDRQLQLAAAQIDRVEGRYTQLYKVAATSCAICGDEDPLWEIRARRVVHDQEEKQLYFDNAVFRIRGVPVFWLPYVRLPDPTLKRATGLLVPEVRSTNLLGLGIKTPYFFRMGDHRDLTLTPYISPFTTTLEARYRQAYINGEIAVNGAISQDTIRPDALRGYVFANGAFALPRDYSLSFQVQTSSDDGYLLDYGYSTRDRLESNVLISRYDADTAFSGGFIAYQGLLPAETNDSTPPLLAEVSYDRLLYPAAIGGRLRLTASADALLRPGTLGGERDVARFGAGADWARNWVSSGGLVADIGLGLALDGYATNDDPGISRWVGRAAPEAAATLRWPHMATSAARVTHVIEPVIAFAWSDSYGDPVANEDSTRVELDESNLFSAAHFPGQDRYESGARLAYGASWTRDTEGGIASRLTFGRIHATDPSADFSVSSGLSTPASDWFVTGQISMPWGLRIDGRTLLGDSLEPAKTEARIGWQNQKVSLSASYVWLDADLAEDRPDAVSEWAIDADYTINPMWTLHLDSRFDVVAQEPAQAGLGVTWQNECVTVELSASRRYTSSITVQPSTDIRLAVGLNGFSAGRSGISPARVCDN